MPSRFTIRHRVFIGFSISVLLALAGLGIGVLQFSAMRARNLSAETQTANLQRVLEASHLLETVRRAETHYRLDTDEASLEQRDVATEKVDTLLRGAGLASPTPEIGAALSTLRSDLGAHNASFDRLVRLTETIRAANLQLAVAGRSMVNAATALLATTMRENDPAAQEAARQAERLLLGARAIGWRFLALHETSGPAAIQLDGQQARAILATLASTHPGPIGDKAAALATAAQAYAALFDTLATATLEGVELDERHLVPEIVAMQHRLAAVQATLSTAFQSASVQNQQAIDDATLLQETIAGILMITGSLLAFFIGRRIATPITAMTAAMSRLAGGDQLVVVPSQERGDEIGAMARAVAVFKESMIRADTLTGELKQQIARREEAEAVAADLARHDPLTGLPNRRLFTEEIMRRLGGLAADQRLAVMLIDLDGFKAVNDVHGHHAGDRVLQEVVIRLRRMLHGAAFVARLGGDEFAVLVPTGRDDAEIERVAYAIIQAAGTPVPLPEAVVQIGASIGIAFAPTDGMNHSDLLRSADIAMYRAKAQGGGAMCFFEAVMDVEMRAHATLREQLRAAIPNREIVPFYQPLVDLRRSRVAGFEVLARWRHPVHGLMSPDRFIPLAEQMKLSTAMTLSLLEQACADAAAWPPSIRLAINIAPTQLCEPALLERIVEVLRRWNVSPERLELELVEDALIGNLDEARRFIDAAHAAGMTIALDDFGTGHSSLSRLYELPLDKVKIDRSFMRDIARDPRSAAYVAAIVNLGKTLELTTTAEGIEDEEVMWKLDTMGCDYGQGYLYAKPVPGHEVDGVLATMRDKYADLDMTEYGGGLGVRFGVASTRG